MLRTYSTTLLGWLSHLLVYLRQRCHFLQGKPQWQLERRPPLNQLATMPRQQLPRFVQESVIACHYLEWLGALDWEHFPERCRNRGNHTKWRGPQPEAAAPYVAAFLVKVDRQLPHMTDLRQWLVEQPALPWLFGFPLQASPHFPWGFDVDASLPAHRHFNRVLRRLPNKYARFIP